VFDLFRFVHIDHELSYSLLVFSITIELAHDMYGRPVLACGNYKTRVEFPHYQ
jgi:hypothetical protein